jgi:uncharacterized protein YkwD
VSWNTEYVRIEELMLTRINQLRAEGRSCGSMGYFPPAQPLKMNPSLRCAARKYARGPYASPPISCSHIGPNGDEFDDRAALAGYLGSAAGENLLCGGAMSGSAADNWLSSDGHCAVLMNYAAKEIGIGLSTYTVMMTGYGN